MFLLFTLAPQWTSTFIILESPLNTGHVHLGFKSGGEVAILPNTWTNLPLRMLSSDFREFVLATVDP